LRSLEAPLKVLYIAGEGHSGSTFLDIMLGNHPDIFGAGELVNLPRGGWIDDEYCTCRKRASDCPFWSDVRRHWVEQVGVDDVEGYLELQDSFERFRRWPRLLWEWRRPSARFKTYTERTRALFEAVREVSGKTVIVDSSKSPPRAFVLALMADIDLNLVHLMRDGRGVAASHKKSWTKDLQAGVTRNVKKRSVWETAARWISVNLGTEWVRLNLSPDKSVRLRYEDYVADPKEALDKIGQMIDLDLTEVASTVSAGGAIKVGHNIAGNHLRMSETIRLVPETGRWRNGGALSTGQQRLSWILMGRLLRRYGYKE
jgi:hypothetical protein